MSRHLSLPFSLPIVYLIFNNSREGFRIIPILLLILVLYGYASAVSERRRVHWPELVAVFLVAAFTMMGHVLNGIPALGIGLAILAYCLITRNFHWNTIWMAVAAGLGITVISRRSVERELRAGTLLRFEVPGISFKRSFRLLYHKDKYISPDLQKVMAVCMTLDCPDSV